MRTLYLFIVLCAFNIFAGEPPAKLSETGFFSSDAKPFNPQYPLWSNGLSKRRWIALPPGTKIDTSDPDHFVFPIGTRFWKEFSSGNRLVETRYSEKIGTANNVSSWKFAVYKWLPDGSDALKVSAGADLETGVEVAPGITHRIPRSEADCKSCHARGGDAVLGFDRIQLADERDPDAPHASALSENDLTLSRLVTAGLLSAPVNAMNLPLTGKERTAAGYLHGNCGSCHNSGGRAAGEIPRFRLEGTLASRSEVPVISSLLFNPEADGIIAPGHADDSRIIERLLSPDSPMPPIGVQLKDQVGITLVKDWINALSE